VPVKVKVGVPVLKRTVFVVKAAGLAPVVRLVLTPTPKLSSV